MEFFQIILNFQVGIYACEKQFKTSYDADTSQ